MRRMLTTRLRTFAASVALLIAAAMPLAVAQPTADPFAGFDPFVESVMKEWSIPGLAVGAIKDGKVVLAKGYGLRDVEKGLPVTEKTLMAIGSNSKSFTVTLMGMLSDEGKLDWDKPVREYLPDFQLQNDAATRMMTPTDLVTHRSGLPRHDRMWFATGLSRKEMYDRLRFLEPSATFRQRYQYNNLMFMTAGYLTEKITGDSWENLIKQRIFMPLGMTRSNTSVRDMPASGDHALPYLMRDRKVTAVPYRNIDAVGPAGSINSSVEEMLKYVQMHIDQGNAGGRQIISKRFSALMQSLHSAPPPNLDLDAPTYTEFGPGGYGLGVNVRSYRGQKIVEHGGGIDGFISAMSWMPHARVGVIVLTNFSGVNPVPPVVVSNVYDRLLGLEQVDFRSRAKATQARNERQGTERERKRAAERVMGTSPSRPLAQFTGTFEHPAYGPVTIVEKDGGLAVTHGSETTTYEHFHYDVFQPVATKDTMEWSARPRISFTSGVSGKLDKVAIPLEPALPDIVFTRKRTQGT
jgi:CubicO group peptidase (beta-lactamase class C family)